MVKSMAICEFRCVNEKVKAVRVEPGVELPKDYGTIVGCSGGRRLYVSDDLVHCREVKNGDWIVFERHVGALVLDQAVFEACYIPVEASRS